MATYSAVMSDDRYTLYLDVTERSGSVNITNNTSIVDYTLRLGFVGTVGAWSSDSSTKYSLTINGVAIANLVSYNYDFRNLHAQDILRTGNMTITHSADGSKTIACSGYATMADGKGSASPSGNLALTTIARASQPTLSASSQALGSVITIYTNKAAAFTHTLSYVFGSQSGTIATNVVDNYAWTLPLTLANAIPSATSGTGTITCITYNGATQIGTKTVSFTATVPNNTTFKPVVGTITPSAVVVQVGSPAVSGYRKSKTKVKITLTAPTLRYGASVSSYKTTVNGQTLYGATVTSDILNTVGTNTISVYLTDSRGFTSAVKTTTITVDDYFSPRIDIFTASRNATTNTTVDTRRKATFPTGITSSGRLLKNGTAIYTWGSGNFDVTSAPTGFSTDTSYTVTLELTDNYGTISRAISIPTAFSLMNFNASGKGMAIGQVSTEATKFQVGIPAVFNAPITFPAGSSVSPEKGIYHPSSGALIDICDDGLTNMVFVHITGNGYGGTPINTICQAYHNTPYGSFVNVKQINFGDALPAGKFLLLNGRLCLWIQQHFTYQTFVVKAYKMSGYPCSVSIVNSAEPTSSYKVTCSMVGIDATTLSGLSTASAATASTIAERTANGYLYATYFNQSGGLAATTASSYFYESSSDGFLRKKSLANVKTEIVTKAAVEASLTGAITSHNHAIMAPSVAITNVHAYRETGYYYGNAISYAPKAAPYTYHHIKYDATNCVVVAYPQVLSTGASDGFVYWKMCKAGVWGAWFRINL